MHQLYRFKKSNQTLTSLLLKAYEDSMYDIIWENKKHEKNVGWGSSDMIPTYSWNLKSYNVISRYTECLTVSGWENKTHFQIVSMRNKQANF